MDHVYYVSTSLLNFFKVDKLLQEFCHNIDSYIIMWILLFSPPQFNFPNPKDIYIFYSCGRGKQSNENIVSSLLILKSYSIKIEQILDMNFKCQWF